MLAVVFGHKTDIQLGDVYSYGGNRHEEKILSPFQSLLPARNRPSNLDQHLTQGRAQHHGAPMSIFCGMQDQSTWAMVDATPIKKRHTVSGMALLCAG
jgi:hypothetical protein